MMRYVIQGFLLAFFMVALFAPVPLRANEIWLAGVDPYVREAMKKGDPSDYQNLFQSQAAWPAAAAKTSVFKTSTQWIMNGPDEALSQMFANLRERHIALAVEGMMIPRTEQQCGARTEGYSAPGTMAAVAERIRKLGGTLAYIGMDEPLWFGHHQDGPNACHSSLDDLAHAVAMNVQAVRAVFPDVQIGDIEVIQASAGTTWMGEIMAWSEAYKKATGTKLAFLHADVQWDDLQSANLLPGLAAQLHSRGIKFGVIYNGDPKDSAGADWIRHAEERFNDLEAGQNLVPDHAVLQTWMLEPAHFLPETSDATMTHLVLRYARKRSKIEGSIVKGQFSGSLTDVKGQPIPNAAVSILARQDGLTGELSSHKLSGLVPANAASAIVVLRINSECNCDGDADIGLGQIHYQDKGGKAATRVFRSAGKPLDVKGAAQFKAVKGHSQQVFTPDFPVTPQQPFELTVPMRASLDAARSGYLALIFLGADKKEVRRDELPFQPGEKEVAGVRTDAQGRFNVDADLASGRAVFAGNEQYRYSEWKLGQ
jgi:hypothetical protein